MKYDVQFLSSALGRIESSLLLVFSEPYIRALHEFMVFVPQEQINSGTVVKFVDDTIVKLALVAKAVKSLRDDGTGTVRGIRRSSKMTFSQIFFQMHTKNLLAVLENLLKCGVLENWQIFAEDLWWVVFKSNLRNKCNGYTYIVFENPVVAVS